MPWQWFRPGEQIPNNQANNDIISACIVLLKATARVHLEENFPKAATDPDYLRGIRTAIGDNNFAIAYHIPDGEEDIDQTFFIQRAVWLQEQLDDEAVWNVSYGFRQDVVGDAWTPDEHRDHIRRFMTPPMDEFRSWFPNNPPDLFSIDDGPPHVEANPLGKKIGRLQTHGEGAQWRMAQQTHYKGNTFAHRYWGRSTDGGQTYEFTLTRLQRK